MPTINKATITKQSNTDAGAYEHRLRDIDENIIKMFTQNINLRVIENNQIIEVPVVFAKPERWAQVQKHSAMLDKDRQPILPAMMIRRTSIDVQPDMYIHPSHEVIYRRRLASNQNAFKTNKPVYEIQTIRPPIFVEISYSLNI